MRQLLAGLAALGLIVTALFVRQAIEGDDDDGGGGGSDSTVVCPPELAQPCQALADDHTVEVEDASVTADMLAGANGPEAAGADVWLVPRPWAEWVRAELEDRGVEDVVGEPTATIARSPVALVIWDDRAAALEAGACSGEVAWRCLGDAADRPWAAVGGEDAWGRVKVGIVDPTSATGMAVLGGAVGGFFGSSTYASNDFGGELSGWLGALGADADAANAGDPVARMVTRGAGEFSAVGALEAEARAAAGRDGLRVLYPAPVATADLVAVPLGGADDTAGEVTGDDDLRQALAEAGWRVDGQPLAAGVAGDLDLPDDDGLPNGSVLRALLDRWTEVIG